MAHSLSAKKRVRQNEKRRARNRARKSDIRGALKTLTASMTAGDLAKAETDLNTAVVVLDRTAAKHTIHKNAAARKRSRLTKRLNALKAAKAAGGAGTKAATA